MRGRMRGVRRTVREADKRLLVSSCWTSKSGLVEFPIAGRQTGLRHWKRPGGCEPTQFELGCKGLVITGGTEVLGTCLPLSLCWDSVCYCLEREPCQGPETWHIWWRQCEKTPDSAMQSLSVSVNMFLHADLEEQARPQKQDSIWELTHDLLIKYLNLDNVTVKANSGESPINISVSWFSRS